MFVVLDPDGTRWLCALTPDLVAMLHEMFDWIESDDPAVRKRLDPDTFRDPDEERAWRNLMGSELAHLVASRRQVVLADLSQAVDIGNTGWLRVPVPDGHLHAWLASLNAARLALFTLHGLSQADMDVPDDDEVVDETRRVVLARIHLLGFLQEMLMAAPEDIDIEVLEPDDGDEEDDDEPPVGREPPSAN